MIDGRWVGSLSHYSWLLMAASTPPLVSCDMVSLRERSPLSYLPKRKTQGQLCSRCRQHHPRTKTNAQPLHTILAVLAYSWSHRIVLTFGKPKKCQILTLKVLMIIAVHGRETRLFFDCHTTLVQFNL